MPNNNGDDTSLLQCWQEIEGLLPPRTKESARRLGLHILRMERRIGQMEHEHTDPNSGKPFDVQKAFSNLNGMHLEVTSLREEQLMMRRMLARVEGGMWVLGVVTPLVLGLLVYFFHLQQEATNANTKLIAETVKVVERISANQEAVMHKLDMR